MLRSFRKVKQSCLLFSKSYIFLISLASLKLFLREHWSRQNTRARGRKSSSSINYRVFWKTILNKWFGFWIYVLPLLTHFHSVNRKVFILMTSFQFMLLVRSEAKMICYKSKLFSLHVLELIQNVLLQGWVMVQKNLTPAERSPWHVTKLN